MSEERRNIQREPAWRLFANEFNDTTLEHQESGQYAPKYLVTPLGARVNRAYVVGVLTSNENTGENLDSWRAQVTDPTGVFHLFAGQYEPEAAKALSELTPPAIVAVVGKVRAYRPEEGVVYTSIRPEVVMPVSTQARDAWILEASRHTLDRIEAVAEASKMDPPTVEALVDLGFSERIATGVVQALDHYGAPNLDRYGAAVEDALGYLLPDLPKAQIMTTTAGGATQTAESEAKQAVQAAPGGGATPAPETTPEAEAADQADEDEPAEDVEELMEALVKDLDEGDGAAWEDIVDAADDKGINEEQVEEALNALMDQGRIFEPVLGRLKPA